MLAILLSALAGAGGMAAAVRYIKRVRDVVVIQGGGGPGEEGKPK